MVLLIKSLINYDSSTFVSFSFFSNKSQIKDCCGTIPEKKEKKKQNQETIHSSSSTRQLLSSVPMDSNIHMRLVIGADLLIVISIAYKVFVFIILNEINFFGRCCDDVTVCELL